MPATAVPAQTPSPAEVRASDQDREQTVALLCHHWHAGRLSAEELEERVEEAWRARFVSGLWNAVRELPLEAPSPQRDAPPGNGSAVAGFVTSLLAACLLVISFGTASIVTVPASTVGWGLGQRGRRSGTTGAHRGLARAGEIIGFLGVVFGVIALLLWAIVISSANSWS